MSAVDTDKQQHRREQVVVCGLPHHRDYSSQGKNRVQKSSPYLADKNAHSTTAAANMRQFNAASPSEDG